MSQSSTAGPAYPWQGSLLLDEGEVIRSSWRGNHAVVAFKCPQCKAPLTMPENGSFAKCTYCGSTVYASDIMDRVKQLIV